MTSTSNPTSKLPGALAAMGALFLLAALTGCGGTSVGTGPSLGAQLYGIGVEPEGVQFAFNNGASALLRFDSLGCSSSGVHCALAFAPAASSLASACTLNAATLACSSPSGEVLATADGTYAVELATEAGRLVVEGTFDRAAGTGSFHVVSTGICPCDASGTFEITTP